MIPLAIRNTLKQTVYQKADDYKYLNQDRAQNRVFISELVADPEVGGILKQFISPADIKTYVKDSILNKYAKQRANTALAIDPASTLQRLYKAVPVLIEKRQRVSLYSLGAGAYAVCATGTFLKWETAFRQALEFLARSKQLAKKRVKPRIALLVTVKRTDSTNGDLELAKKALRILRIDMEFVHL